jgi:hypothetical protein
MMRSILLLAVESVRNSNLVADRTARKYGRGTACAATPSPVP